MVSRDPIFYWMLTHYYIPEARYFSDGAWMVRRLRNMLLKKQTGRMDFSFFDPIDDDANIFETYLQGALPLSGAKNKPAVSSATPSSQPPSQRPSPPTAMREQVKQLQQEISDLRNSTSWKITRPLRFVGERLKSFRS